MSERNNEIRSIKANQLRLGYPVYKNSRLISISIDDLNEILKEESFHLEKRQYKPIVLSEKWLNIMGFEKTVIPFTKDILFIHESSGLRVRPSKNMKNYCLGYILKEKKGNVDYKYCPDLIFLHDLFDAFLLLKRMSVNLTCEQIEQIEQLLKNNI